MFLNFKPLRVVFKENFYFFLVIFLFLFLLYFRGLSAILLSDEISATYFHKFLENRYNILRIDYFSIKTFFYFLATIFVFESEYIRIATISLHVVNFILFFYLFRNFFSEKILKLTSFLICSHTLFTESLVWLAAQHYVYMGFLYLISMVFSYLATKDKSLLYYLIACLPITILTVSGAHGIFAPIVFVIFNILILNRNWLEVLKQSSWLILLIPLKFFFTREVLTNRVASLQGGFYLEKYLDSLPFSIFKGFEILIFPLNSTFFHEETLSPLYLISAKIFTVLLILTLILLLFKKRFYFGIIALGLSVPIYMFSPVQVSWFIAERYLYFTTFIACLLLAKLTDYLSRIYSPRIVYAIFSIYFIFFTFRTYLRIEDWQSHINLWSQNIKMAPDSYRVRLYLSDALIGGGFLIEAIENLEILTAKFPESSEANFFLGMAYIRANRYDEAKNSINKALEQDPNQATNGILTIASEYIAIRQFQKADQILSTLEFSDKYDSIRPMVEEVRSRMRVNSEIK